MLKIIATTTEKAAPTGSADLKILKGLKDNSELFAKSEFVRNPKSFGRSTGLELVLSLPSVLEELKRLGWTKQNSISVPKFSAHSIKEWVVCARANGDWPLDVKKYLGEGSGVRIDVQEKDNDQDNGESDGLAFTRIAKKLMPAGTSVHGQDGSGPLWAQWRKDHGHAGSKIIGNMVAKAKSMGFTPLAGGDHHSNSPDGGHVAYGSSLEWNGFVLTWGEHYGNTAYENSFWARLSYDPHRKD